MDVNEELTFCENSKKKLGGGVGRGVSWGIGLVARGGGVRVDVNKELYFFCEN